MDYESMKNKYIYSNNKVSNFEWKIIKDGLNINLFLSINYILTVVFIISIVIFAIQQSYLAIASIVLLGLNQLFIAFAEDIPLCPPFIEKYRLFNKSYYMSINGEKEKYYSYWYLVWIGKSRNIRFEVERPIDKDHWKNTLETNRPLTIREFRKMRKNFKLIQQSFKNEEDIKEFQEYHGFTSKNKKEINN